MRSRLIGQPILQRRAGFLSVLTLVALAGCNCGVDDGTDGGSREGGEDSGPDLEPDGGLTDGGANDDSGTSDDGGLTDSGVDDDDDGGGDDDSGTDDDGGPGDAGRDDDGGPGDDGGEDDGGLDDGGPHDGGAGDDAGSEPPSFFAAPLITICSGDSLPPPSSGRCQVTSGSAGLLLTGDVLTPGEVLRGGQVLVDTEGVIACVSCDCSGVAPAGTATEVVCPDAVISPGLINSHDHVTFAGAWPYGDTRPDQIDRMTEERYEHRHDWRQGVGDHTRIPSAGAMSGTSQMQWLELRQLWSGTTSVFGSGGPAGLLRNLDSSTRNGLPREGGTYQTFPLGDAITGLRLEDGCAYSGCTGSDCFDPQSDLAFVPHVAEGIDASARNEFLCLSGGGSDVNEPQSAFVHGVALLPLDMAHMAEEEVELIWSPRTNITLYGDTARVTELARLGVTIGLGTDWVATGSMNMLRELACADTFNQRYLDGFFADEQLWLMATRNSARALRVDDVLGTLAVGYAADIALFDASLHEDHRAVLMARPEDVVLVMIGGKVSFGDAALVEGIAPGCELVPQVCGEEKRACLSAETCYPGCTLASGSPTPCTFDLLRNCGENHPTSPQYPLYFCGEPADEPSCWPARNAMEPLPSPHVNGSNRYDGFSSLDDVDGDGILNDSDSCPAIFNPIRPLDNGSQSDFDADGLGDACDPCPLGGDDEPETCNILPHLDLDRDGVQKGDDNCPAVANPQQEDEDLDDLGDACDPCPTFHASRGSQTVYSARCGGVAAGESVTLSELIVTAVAPDGFFAQQDPASGDYAGADYSGIFVFTGTSPAELRGDVITVTGALEDDAGLARLTGPSLTLLGSSLEPAAIVVDPQLIAAAGPSSEPLESLLVRVEEVTVTGAWAAAAEFQVDDILWVSAELFDVEAPAAMGEQFDYLQGPLSNRGLVSTVLLRDAADLGFTTFVLSPASVEVEVGHSQTFTVVLPFDAPLEGAVVTLTVDPAELLSGPGSVVVPASQRLTNAVFLAGGAGSGTLTASYGELSSVSAVSIVTPAALLISEYVEGSSSNKALELTNVGGSTASLSACTLRLYSNGSQIPSASQLLSGSLAPGAQFVICNAGTDNAATRCDATSPVINYNGDDALDLVCDGVTVDVFGRIGEQPALPSAWTGGGVSTLDYVLTRRCEVSAGDVDGTDAFDPSLEWLGAAWSDPTTSLAGLGTRSECPGEPAAD